MKIIVIGASSGYGKGIAEALEKEHVVIKLSRSLNGFDVTNPSIVADFFEKIDTVDAIIYSAGIAIGNSTVEEGNYTDWLRVFKTNVVGLMSVAKYGLPKLSKQGSFIHIGSIAYSFSYKGGVDYCASKAAAHSVMQGLRHEYFGTGKKIVTIEPGLGETNFQLNRYKGDADKAKQHFGNIQQLLPKDLSDTVKHILAAPPHVNYDIIVVKPTDQLAHGKLKQ